MNMSVSKPEKNASNLFAKLVLFFGALFLSLPLSAEAGILEQVENELVELADRVRPAVVSLSPYIAKDAIGDGLTKKGGRPANAGAGAIYDAEKGLLVTNSHVVRNVQKIKVKFMDGREVIGEVLGADEDTDLAVVHVESEIPLVAVEFGDSSKVRVGQLVVAVGNPYGLNDTTTFGIISGLKRENVNLSRYEDFIQTDASINPGNSGGPLLNIKGEVIGINTAIINYAQSIGFSIPSNMVKHVVGQLVVHGEVHRGWLGVGIDPVSEEVAKQMQAQKGVGVIINSVFEGDPADRAGLKVGDIILKIGGAKIDSPNSMIRVIGAITPGQTINLDILRAGVLKVVPIKLESRKKRTAQLSQMPILSSTVLGFGVINSVEEERQGAQVSKIDPKSVAALKGLQLGDLIVAVNGKAVVDLLEFDRLLGQVEIGSPVFMLVWRNDKKFHLGLVREN
ncbi:MAG: PDZ domain-containing protein [Nitrospina sp.]|nr:PDZ domain-containing protein [Nitrospina sp.]